MRALSSIGLVLSALLLGGLLLAGVESAGGLVLALVVFALGRIARGCRTAWRSCGWRRRIRPWPWPRPRSRRRRSLAVASRRPRMASRSSSSSFSIRARARLCRIRSRPVASLDARSPSTFASASARSATRRRISPQHGPFALEDSGSDGARGAASRDSGLGARDRCASWWSWCSQ